MESLHLSAIKADVRDEGKRGNKDNLYIYPLACAIWRKPGDAASLIIFGKNRKVWALMCHAFSFFLSFSPFFFQSCYYIDGICYNP
jgi:hypothetical protein